LFRLRNPWARREEAKKYMSTSIPFRIAEKKSGLDLMGWGNYTDSCIRMCDKQVRRVHARQTRSCLITILWIISHRQVLRIPVTRNQTKVITGEKGRINENTI